MSIKHIAVAAFSLAALGLLLCALPLSPADDSVTYARLERDRVANESVALQSKYALDESVVTVFFERPRSRLQRLESSIGSAVAKQPVALWAVGGPA